MRVRVLIEVADDLHALYLHHRQTGLGEEKSAERARRQLLASPEAVRELVRVHSAGYSGLLARISGRLQRGFTLFFLAGGVLPLLALSCAVALPQLLDGDRAPVRTALLGIVGMLLLLASAKLHQLYIGSRERIYDPHRGLVEVLFLGGVGAALGALGFTTELRSVLVELSLHPATAADGARLIQAIGQGATVLAIGMLTGFSAAITWFVLARRAAALEREESLYLLAE